MFKQLRVNITLTTFQVNESIHKTMLNLKQKQPLARGCFHISKKLLLFFLHDFNVNVVELFLFHGRRRAH